MEVYLRGWIKFKYEEVDSVSLSRLKSSIYISEKGAHNPRQQTELKTIVVGEVAAFRLGLGEFIRFNKGSWHEVGAIEYPNLTTVEIWLVGVPESIEVNRESLVEVLVNRD